MPTILFLPSEAARIARIPENQERQMRQRLPALATMERKRSDGGTSVRYSLTDCLSLFLIVQQAHFGLPLHQIRVATDIAIEQALRAFASGAAAPWTFNIGIPGQSDSANDPIYRLAIGAGEQVAIQREWATVGRKMLNMPLSGLINDFCLRAAGELGFTITPADVLSSSQPSDPEG